LKWIAMVRQSGGKVMVPAVKIVSELFMMVLSILATPTELNQFRLDQIQHSGRIETLIVQRTETGFVLQEQQDGKLIARGTIRPVTGKPETFSIELGNEPAQIYDFAAAIRDFTVAGLRKAQTLDLKVSDGTTIQVQRSGSAVYLTPMRMRTTYACH